MTFRTQTHPFALSIPLSETFQQINSGKHVTFTTCNLTHCTKEKGSKTVQNVTKLYFISY